MASSLVAATSSAAAAASSRHQHVTIRVLVAETGATYKITLAYTDLNVANLRSHLAAAVPPADQILLIGPPYKVPKDPIFQSDEILNALRLGDIEDDPMSNLVRESTPASAATTDENKNTDESINKTSPHPSSLLKLPRRRLLSTTTSSSSTTATSASGAKRVFLFSKAALLPVPSPSFLSTADTSTATRPPSPVCRLPPLSVTLPTDVPPGPSPLADALAAAATSSSSSTTSTSASSPLHQALLAYEGQFRMYLEQGRVLADAADVRVHSCITCLQEQAVMARALQAAVSNLQDHSMAASKTRSEFAKLFQTKILESHSPLLQGFEGLLQRLANIPLHPALIQAAAARASSSTTSTMQQHTIASMNTLLDTVPVERERNWMQQCQLSHSRLVTLFQQLEADFTQLFSSNASNQEQDEQAILQLEQKWDLVQGSMGRSIQQEQAQRLSNLTACHSQVVKTILNAILGGDSSTSSDAAIQAAFVPLGELSEKSSKSLVPSMMQADIELQKLQQAIAESKVEWMKRIKVRLREISAAQSGIQKALSNLSVLRDAVKQQCENMEHLEHVAELPSAYQQFLQEIQRRRAFGQAVSASTTALLERLAALREDEIKAREKFLRGPGRHLMPAFYEVFVPSLASPPPLFAPPQLQSLNEMDTLPNITSTTVTATTATAGGGGSSSTTTMTAPASGGGGDYSTMQVAAEQHGGVSSASSLTTSEPSSGGVGGGGGVQQQQQQQHHQEQLIVSASEQSGNDLYLDPATGAAAEAEARTLAYENLILRQALERLGGKPPRSYIQEARSNSSAAAAASAAAVAAACAREEKALGEVTVLKKELAEAKARAEVAAEALKVASAAASSTAGSSIGAGGGLCDKISHSSFQVGDVGLFMPTGRGSGGKRTYLAFHTKCPYRFLSTDNIKGTPDFVLGRIVYQEELVAGELGTDANPYGLPVGTKFWVLTVEVLTSQT